MGLKDCGTFLDIPPEFGSTKKYRATLGHKINHSFRPNAIFATIDTARFGVVSSLRTIRRVSKDEEFLVSYNYPFGRAPPWYREVYREAARTDPIKAAAVRKWDQEEEDKVRGDDRDLLDGIMGA